jgi:competence protein ComEA
MRSRSLATQHDAAVSRRLELLTNELAAVSRGGVVGDTSVRRAESWSPQAHTRIRAVPDLDETEETEEADEPAGPAGGTGPAPSDVRLPGRHASRRATAFWTDAVPEGLRGRVVLGAGQVAVVSLLVALGLALTCWWLVRSGGHEEAAPTDLTTPHAGLATPGAPAGAAPASDAIDPSSPAAAPARVVVDVTGKVRRPGIAVLRQGARVVDALRAAGGPRPGVHLGGLNLAQVLTDGEQVVVGSAPAGGPMTSGPTGAPPVTGLVDINTADETALESLPDVGPVTAASILAWRTQHGSFTSVDQLLDVDGIGDATLAKLTPYVTV